MPDAKVVNIRVLIKDEMNREVTKIHPDKSVRFAGQIMKAVDIGCMCVVEGDRLVGILTERDLAQKVVADGLDEDATLVRDVMTRDVVTLNSKKTIKEAVKLMEERNIKKIPVVEDGRIVGIVTMTDLFKKLGELELDGKAK